MAINVYSGVMGSGKSYEVVSSVILPAIRQGRRVVTNIDGIDVDKFNEYVHEKYNIHYDKIGEIIVVSTDDIQKPGFFPNDEDLNSDSIVRPGDLLAVDECWRFWSSDSKITAEHMSFFRMHRHYAHPTTGVTCDIALMIQDIGTLHRKLKSVVEMTAKMTKIKTLGLSKIYRVQLYEGSKLYKTALISTTNRKYDAEIFPLYQSYSSDQAKEAVIDDRQNILKNPTVWILFFVTVSLLFFGGYNAYKFFKGPPTQETVAPSSSSSAAAVPTSSSSKWRLAGHVLDGDANFVVLANDQGRLRYETTATFSGHGMLESGVVDGERINAWSGPLPSIFSSNSFASTFSK